MRNITSDTLALTLEGHGQGSDPMVASIYQLPNELLVKIFRHATGIETGNTSTDHYQQLHILSQVCKAWTGIARSPELWTVLGSRDPRWERALSRSLGCPLIITMRSIGEVDPHFWPAMTDNLHRWRVADLVLRRDLAVLVEKDSAPMLEILSLVNIPQAGAQTLNRVIEDLFQGNVPRLRSLTLDRIGLRNWGSKALTGLRLLHLHRISEEASPSVDQVLRVLRACPDIEDLLIHATPVLHGFGPAPKHKPIHLPRLQSLTLDIIPIKAIELLLNPIKSSRVNQLRFQIARLPMPDMARLFIGVLTEFVTPSFTTAVNAGCRIELSIDIPWEIVIAPKSSYSASNFRLTLPMALKDLSWLSSLLKMFGGGLPVSIFYSHPYPAIAQIPFIDLSSMPAVDCIEFGPLPQGLDRIVQELSQPVALSNDSGARVWVFPGLKNVRLREAIAYDPRMLLGMVQARTIASAATGEEDQSVAHPQPVMLEGLTIPKADLSMDAETWREIEKILGDGASWEASNLSWNAEDRT
ncbi:hypothetical protein FRB97_007651 [Tulasnella sp. 331]|nr:hypothetical protein FRB97_007651 [Tulasnella sp. 331]